MTNEEFSKCRNDWMDVVADKLHKHGSDITGLTDSVNKEVL